MNERVKLMNEQHSLALWMTDSFTERMNETALAKKLLDLILIIIIALSSIIFIHYDIPHFPSHSLVHTCTKRLMPNQSHRAITAPSLPELCSQLSTSTQWYLHALWGALGMITSSTGCPPIETHTYPQITQVHTQLQTTDGPSIHAISSCYQCHMLLIPLCLQKSNNNK